MISHPPDNIMLTKINAVIFLDTSTSQVIFSKKKEKLRRSSPLSAFNFKERKVYEECLTSRLAVLGTSFPRYLVYVRE